MPCHTISGHITLEFALHYDAVLRLYELPAHATWPLKWGKQMILAVGVLAVGVQVPDNIDSGRGD